MFIESYHSLTEKEMICPPIILPAFSISFLGACPNIIRKYIMTILNIIEFIDVIDVIQKSSNMLILFWTHSLFLCLESAEQIAFSAEHTYEIVNN